MAGPMSRKIILRALVWSLFVSGALSACPSGWSQYSNYCYKPFTSTKTWNSASAACTSFGSRVNLVSIHSSGENNFVRGICSGGWIGLRNHGGYYSPYSYTDGTPYDYANYASGQPDDNDGTEDCIGMWPAYGDLWNDFNCGVSKYYVCKVEACNNIPNCDVITCIITSNVATCQRCNGNYGPALGQAYLNKGTFCEENCSWRSTSTICYPGNCPDGEDSCICETGFTGYDCTTLVSSEAPSYNFCLTKLHHGSGGTVELNCINEGQVSYTNQPGLTLLENDWRSSYTQPTVTFPPYITNFKLGMVRGTTIATIYNNAGTASREVARIACTDSATRDSPNQALYQCADSSPINLSGWTVAHRDRIDVQIEIENGGYVTVNNPDTSSQFKKYYTGITLRRTGSFTFDLMDPLHCLPTGGCSIPIFTCGNDVTKRVSRAYLLNAIRIG
ncbi:E-selectin-like [Anneissia japonica]|uniref:E-selectin-like n=1 Tax=Anneissia japonica TaxID=1529436 RepID=UPI0014256EE6|nr:E-selectin-like [Anneissia japonica]